VQPHEADDNARIIEIIKERMAVGIERYGHGLRVEDDTRQWGTKQDSWVEMGLEEVLDNLIYVAAAMLRIENEKKALQDKIDELEKAAKELRQAQMRPTSIKTRKPKWWHRFRV
tara:strand:+ start:4576 stop:4917 length:342 start_codon:yes stop_codon:yes gene_type:complete